ncbi:MAG: DUF2750 domain-containing protein [Granulosicoccaceae bacterium]|jgi:hypothetical protein
MRYSPLDSELAILDTLSAEERLHYATTRIIESEEVWSLGDDNGWRIRDRDDKQLISIWPYRQLVLEHCSGNPESPLPQSTSLEHFVYAVLDMCQTNDIWLEIFPNPNEPGYIISSSDLYEILNGMLENNEYFIEG